jgi:hypothetical protein
MGYTPRPRWSQPLPRSSMAQRAPAWESGSYLDIIWHAQQLHWTERAQLLEMHRDGVLAENDLSMATLKSLNSGALHAEGMRAVLLRFRDRFTYTKGRAVACAGTKNRVLQELLREQVTPPRSTAQRSSWHPRGAQRSTATGGAGAWQLAPCL